MKNLHHALESTLLEELKPDAVITRLLKRKASEAGVRLSRRELNRIVRVVQEHGEGTVTVGLRRWRWWEADHSIAVDDSDCQQEMERLEGLSSILPELIRTTSAEIAEEVLNTLKRSWSREDRLQKREHRGFRRRLRRRWKRGLDLLGMLVTVAHELGNEIAGEYEIEPGPKDEPHLSEALFRLHARTCQIALEVRTLLCSGLADGAIARWRTMHELAVVASFLAEHGDMLAERYLDHDAVDAWKATQGYQQQWERLGEIPLSDAELAERQDAYRAVIAKYGESFRRDYGWAAGVLAGKSPTFKEIKRTCEFDHWRPYYHLACQNVHASARGIFLRLGLHNEPILLAGYSNVGLSSPGQNAAISLMQATVTLLRFSPTLDHLVAAQVMQKVVGETCVAFAAVENALREEGTKPDEQRDKHHRPVC